MGNLEEFCAAAGNGHTATSPLTYGANSLWQAGSAVVGMLTDVLNGVSAMPIWRRMLYAVCGLLLVLVSALGLDGNYCTYSMYCRKRAFLNVVFALDHGVTQLVLVVSGAGFYLLASAAQGSRLFSRRWLVSAVAAVILAWMLVGGIAIARGYIWPEPSVPGGVPPVEND